ncbi:hypothetical protein ACMHYO_06320 [Allopusillimonas ginsengisoli]|uniref:hypothetical protein n=1 Tax=Allopusillimonas ginsengisoli TaxID=453575 RepID=UPI0010C18C4C|nr:hypothetical protein D7I39_14110 [Allopusillimonas ginsengisoli]
MYKSTSIFTLSLLAPHFGISEDQLSDLAYANLNVEDGLMWIIGPHESEEMGLTPDGIRNIAEILSDLGNEKAARVLSNLDKRTFFPQADPV